ncbi:hypothetical protein LSPH24S_04558 [Lysinibacillus sphaericus]
MQRNRCRIPPIISGGAWMIRGLRGAITIELDKPELVWDETARLRA